MCHCIASLLHYFIALDAQLYVLPLEHAESLVVEDDDYTCLHPDLLKLFSICSEERGRGGDAAAELVFSSTCSAEEEFNDISLVVKIRIKNDLLLNLKALCFLPKPSLFTLST
jgi:hypothetical protein